MFRERGRQEVSALLRVALNDSSGDGIEVDSPVAVATLLPRCVLVDVSTLRVRLVDDARRVVLKVPRFSVTEFRRSSTSERQHGEEVFQLPVGLVDDRSTSSLGRAYSSPRAVE